MKKIVIFICSMFLILCMCFSFIGCGKPQNPTMNPSVSAENTGNPSSQPTQTPDEETDFDTEPTVNPTTVPKPTTNSNPTVKPTSAPAAGTINVPALTDKMTSIAAIQQSSTSIGNAVLKTYNGNITKLNQKDSYSFTAPRDGIYRIEMSGMKAAMKVGLYIFNELDENLDYTYASANGKGITVALKANKTYQIQVREYEGNSEVTVGAYTLNIWNQKPTTDVTNYTAIKDSIEYNGQKNIYMFTPSVSGTYRLEMTGMKAEMSVGLYIFNELDENLSYTYAGANGEGITVALKANKIYQIQVREYEGNSGATLGSYTLNIWSQKPTVDVNGKVQIKDSIQYTDQQNIYNFTVMVAGKHTIKITGLESSVTTKIYVYNDLDEKVEYDTSYKNNDSISLSNLKVGDSYRIVVYQSGGTGSYTLTIS